MSKTILLTGAAGFIGSHTAEALLKRGDVVVGLDNLNDYYDPGRKRANLSQVELSSVAAGQFTFVQGDTRDRELVSGLFAEHRFDSVVHLAAMARVRASMLDPHLYFDVNLLGTLNILRATREKNVETFVFASTSSVYGNTKQVPFVESDPCDRPLAPYAASKRAAEMLGFTYHYLYGSDFTVLRFFTVYGPRGRPDMMAYKLLDSAFTGQEMPLYNNGQMYRDWTYVEDIVSGVLAAVDRPLGYEVVNLGRGEPVLLSDFVDIVQSLARRRARLVSAPMIAADIAYTYADINKARNLLGHHPKISVVEGVARFWQWYQQTVLGQF